MGFLTTSANGSVSPPRWWLMAPPSRQQEDEESLLVQDLESSAQKKSKAQEYVALKTSSIHGRLLLAFCLAVALLLLTIKFATDSYPWLTSSPLEYPSSSDAPSLDWNTEERNQTIPNRLSFATVPATCDLFSGDWVPDLEKNTSSPPPPLYSAASCPYITSHQNCQRNGRPDRGYEGWRWQPNGCDLPRFNAAAFLSAMRGRRVLFIGDSLARNHMESLLCALYQVEKPVQRGSRFELRYVFRDHKFTLGRLWSSWLVEEEEMQEEKGSSNSTTSKGQAVGGGRPGEKRRLTQKKKEPLMKLHLDRLHPRIASSIPSYDAVLVNSGHWFMKRAVYSVGGKVRGGQLWSSSKEEMSITPAHAFALSLETTLRAVKNMESFKGIFIYRTYSPDHYVGGEWNSGGSCTEYRHPAKKGEYTWTQRLGSIIYASQKEVFAKVVQEEEGAKEQTNRLVLMDVMESAGLRRDGHPGPYRGRNAVATGAQDCTHWCMPGPIDSWNQFLGQLLHRGGLMREEGKGEKKQEKENRGKGRGRQHKKKKERAQR